MTWTAKERLTHLYTSQAYWLGLVLTIVVIYGAATIAGYTGACPR